MKKLSPKEMHRCHGGAFIRLETGRTSTVQFGGTPTPASVEKGVKVNRILGKL